MDTSTRQRRAHHTRIVIALWSVLAFLLWNVVFDRVLVLAGRRYVHAASIAARQGGPSLLIDDWMRPATLTARRWASVSAAAVLTLAFIVVPLARRRAEKPAAPRS